MRCGRAALAGALLAAAFLAPGCSKPGRGAEITVERYLSALQQQDDTMMSLLWAPYRRETANLSPDEKKKHFEGFERLVRQAHQEFESAKQSGTLSPDPLGVAMFRALRLGKGAISVPLGVKLSDDGSTAHVRTRLITNLDNLQLDSLPTGVRVYLMGYPLGRLEMIAVGYQDPSTKNLLGSVDIDWSLSRAPEGLWSPAGWLIESIAADPSTAAKWVPGRRGS